MGKKMAQETQQREKITSPPMLRPQIRKGWNKVSQYFRNKCSASCQMWTYLLCSMQIKKTSWLQCNHILIGSPQLHTTRHSHFGLWVARLQLLKKIPTLGTCQTVIPHLVLLLTGYFEDSQHLGHQRKVIAQYNHNFVPEIITARQIWEWSVGISCMGTIVLWNKC